MSPLVISAILATVTLSAIAQIALKVGISSVHLSPQGAGSAREFLLAATISPFVWLGLLIYGASVLAWLWVLSKVDVSVAYPFVGISFVLTSIMGWLVLHEDVSPVRMAGTSLIILGCILIARSAAQ